jgi:hypothetical protein
MVKGWIYNVCSSPQISRAGTEDKDRNKVDKVSSYKKLGNSIGEMFMSSHDHRHTRELIITHKHQLIIKDESWMGYNVYSMNELHVLIEWWNKTILYAADRITREIKDKSWIDFHAAVWIRVNELHPKKLLKFDDITNPELLRKVA